MQKVPEFQTSPIEDSMCSIACVVCARKTRKPRSVCVCACMLESARISQLTTREDADKKSSGSHLCNASVKTTHGWSVKCIKSIAVCVEIVHAEIVLISIPCECVMRWGSSWMCSLSVAGSCSWVCSSLCSRVCRLWCIGSWGSAGGVSICAWSCG